MCVKALLSVNSGPGVEQPEEYVMSGLIDVQRPSRPAPSN